MVRVAPHDPLNPLHAVEASPFLDATGRVCNHLFVYVGFDDLHDGVAHYLPRVILFIFQIPDLATVRPALHLAGLVLREVKIQYHVPEFIDRSVNVCIDRTDLRRPLRLPSPLGPLDG